MLRAIDNFHYTFDHDNACEPIEYGETEYVGLVLEDRTVIIESFDVDDDVDRTISKVNDKKVIGFVHGLSDDEVPANEILDAFAGNN